MIIGKDESIASYIPAYRFEALYRNLNYVRFIENKVEDTTRYDDRLTIRSNLIKTYDFLMEFTYKHLPEKFYLQDGTTQRGDLRSNIFREIIANLCVHREYASYEAGFFEIYSDRVITRNPTKFTSSLKTGSISIDELDNYTKNPLLFKVFRELGWGEELGSGSRNIKKYAPFYYEKSVIEITNKENFIFSITYSDTTINVNYNGNNSVNITGYRVNNTLNDVNLNRDSVNNAHNGVKSKNKEIQQVNTLSSSKLEEQLFLILEPIKVAKLIKKRMIEEVKQIYYSEKINKSSLLELLGYTSTQIKGDLRVLIAENIISYSNKEKIYSLTTDTYNKLL